MEASPAEFGVCGLCSGRGTTEVDFAMSDCGATAAWGTAAGGVIATEDEGLRSGRGSPSTGGAAGLRSGLGTVPVSIVASDAIEGEGSGAAGTSCAASCPAAGAVGVVSLNGLRSGREGGTCTLAARAGLAAAERGVFATATAGARHANEANSKTCARMRFISSIGFRLRSCSQDVPRAGEPRR